MLTVGDVAQLVGENVCVADLGIYITVRMTVNPIVDVRGTDIIAQLHGKGTINVASAEFFCCTELSWNMVSHHNLIICLTS